VEPYVKINYLLIYITSKCTLNCKLCVAGIPYHSPPRNLLKSSVIREMKNAFELYDEMDHADIMGGEPLLHPDVIDFLHELNKYHSKFKQMRIVTNCTIVPSDTVCEAIQDLVQKGSNVLFLLSNYGKLSKCINEVIYKLDTYHIPYRIDNYVGKNQRFDGWVDFGDFTDRGYTEAEAQQLYLDCRYGRRKGISDCHQMYEGKIYACPYYLLVSVFNKIDPLDNEYINLYDETASIEQKKKILLQMQSKPDYFAACKLCKGQTHYSKRYPAAEQIKKVQGDMHE